MDERLKSFLSKVLMILLVLLPATFPLSRRASSLVLVALIVVWIPLTNWEQLRTLLRNRGFIVLSMIFVISIGSLVYSESKDFFQIEKKLGLIALPLVIGTISITSTQIKQIFDSFIIGCLIAASYSLLFAISLNYKLNQMMSIDNNLYGTEMTLNAIDISHVYFGMYVSFLIAYLLYEIFISKSSKMRMGVRLSIIGFFSIFLFMMGAKMSIIALFILLTIVGIVLVIKKRQWWIAFLVVGIPMLLFSLTVGLSDFARGRFIELVRPENYFVGDNAWNSIGVRLSIYKCAFEVFKESPFFGAGIGDVQGDLNECYQSHSFSSLQDMNAHNQYIQWMLSVGAVGFIVLFAAVVYFFRYSIKSKSWVYFCFYFVVLFCCLTESIFERQHGIMFFSFFNSLLFFHGEGLKH